MSVTAGTPRAACYGAGMALLSTRNTVTVLLLLTLAACNADRSRFPSLAMRPAERVYGSGQPVTPNATAPLEAQHPAGAGLSAKVAALRETAWAAHARFLDQHGPALRLAEAARGAKPGTDAWSRATVALAGLTSARSEGMVALAELDRLMIAATEAAALGSGADLAIVAPAHSEVEARLEGEDQVLASLGNQIGG